MPLDHHNVEPLAIYLPAVWLAAVLLVLALWGVRYGQRRRRGLQAAQQVQLQNAQRMLQLEAVLDASPYGWVSFDRNRHVQRFNPAFVRMTGSGKRALEGMSEDEFSCWLASLCQPAARFSGIQALRNKALVNPADASEMLQLQQAGHRVLQAQLSLCDSGTVSQVLWLHDLTREAEVQSRKSEFLATAAHEMRTPMASIHGFSEVLLTQENDAESQKEFLAIIHKQSEHMVNILNELLDLARMEARRGTDFKFERLVLQDQLAELIKGYQCPAGRNAPELVCTEQPIYVVADAGKLLQALLNVLSNAYKYSPDGGAVRITVAFPDPAPNHGPHVAIQVEDHGIGMTPEQAQKVGKRFYRADTSGRVPGTGLGMAITQEILAHHKGRISIVSAPGEGTQVTVHLPASTAAVA